jgi:hypothetical protein
MRFFHYNQRWAIGQMNSIWCHHNPRFPPRRVRHLRDPAGALTFAGSYTLLEPHCDGGDVGEVTWLIVRQYTALQGRGAGRPVLVDAARINVRWGAKPSQHAGDAALDLGTFQRQLT